VRDFKIKSIGTDGSKRRERERERGTARRRQGRRLFSLLSLGRSVAHRPGLLLDENENSRRVHNHTVQYFWARLACNIWARLFPFLFFPYPAAVTSYVTSALPAIYLPYRVHVLLLGIVYSIFYILYSIFYIFLVVLDYTRDMLRLHSMQDRERLVCTVRLGIPP
jgi:hypothetical protein